MITRATTLSASLFILFLTLLTGKMNAQCDCLLNEDTESPALTGLPYPGTMGTNACMVNAETAVPFSATDAVQGYTDNCSVILTSTLTGTSVTGTDCNWTVTYTFTVFDDCLNPLPGQTYSNTGSDQTAPTLTGVPFAGTTGTNACLVDAETAAPFSSVAAITGYSDNCGATVTATLTGTSVAGTDCSWTITYTFTILDECLNSLSGQTYANTGGDLTAPTGTSTASTTGTNACMTAAAGLFAFDEVAAAGGYTDNCLGSVTAVETGTEVVSGTDCAWAVTYTFSVQDACGNILPGQTYTHTGSDQTAPTLTGVPFAGTTGTNACMADAATAAPFSGASAIIGYSDNCGATVTATLTGTAVTGTNCSWTVTYTFTILDACSNPLPGQTYANTGGDLTAPTGTSTASTTGTNACMTAAAGCLLLMQWQQQEDTLIFVAVP
ncbi:MAG: hypothetical protein IPP15_22595 [Saprospiraceae bacterium]|uniref:Uncharacterized protein n=1 Tax=Candidatus Opimibacter skivensis TaxID=2982028 RepID=A0A9D7SXK9_9BACT|nr:hypothetical protein [Candidatus Opimibacter skivensis]